MSSRAFAIILTRLLGLWIAIEATLRIVELLLWGMSLRGSNAGTGWTSYPPADVSLGASELYLHDTYYVIGSATASLLSPGLKLLLGFVLILAARRIARMLCSRTEEP